MTRESLKFILSALIISGVWFSCRTSTTVSMVPANDSEVEDKIIFVNLKIFRDTTGNEVIVLVDKIWADGKLKKASADIPEPRELLVCEFKDSNKNVLSRVTIQNPLTAVVEEYSSDGTIERKVARATTAYFTIRAAVPSNVVKLQISNEKGKPLSLLELQ